MAKLSFKKILDLPSLPDDRSVVRVASDWSGQPLVLIAEGKPQRPVPPFDTPTWVKWLRTQPRAHSLIYMEDGTPRQVRFDDAVGISTFHVQPIEDGWLVGERRGTFTLYDHTGARQRSFELGDASEDMQTTPDGKIWVSYFDEGVFGRTIAREGVVCFDLNGTPQFRYAEFAEMNKLPFVADCYAMNVASRGDVWLNYYTEFPLVHISDGVAEKVVLEFGSVGNDFAVRDGQVVYSKNGQLVTRSIEPSSNPETLATSDENQNPLVPLVHAHVGFVGRGDAILLNTGTAIYGLAEAPPSFG